MTYFGFLARFLCIPILILSGWLWYDRRHGRQRPYNLRTWSVPAVIIGHIIVAVAYTTPWDNYLVATNVWWYDENLVTGLTIGYVPIEEYTFFVLQTWMTGMWVVWLTHRNSELAPATFTPWPGLRWGTTAVLFTGWAASTVVLLSGWAPATYLTLILSWALIPIMIQTAFGADILWHYRYLLLWGIVPTTLYLGAADALAIYSGTWTISPDQTLGLDLFGILPLEEFLFFFITNVLVVFGTTLVFARASHRRARPYIPAALRHNAAVETP